MPDAELLAALKPPRWPEVAPVVASDDLLVALALGLAAGLVLALLVAVMRRRRRAASPGRAALARIEAASARPAEERLAETAAALRDYIAATEGAEAARIRGADWLAALDRRFGTGFFASGDGRVLAHCLYAPIDERAAEAARAGVADLLRRRAA